MSASLFVDDDCKDSPNSLFYSQLLAKTSTSVYQIDDQGWMVDENDQIVVNLLMTQVAVVKKRELSSSPSFRYEMVQKFPQSSAAPSYVPNIQPVEENDSNFMNNVSHDYFWVCQENNTFSSELGRLSSNSWANNTYNYETQYPKEVSDESDLVWECNFKAQSTIHKPYASDLSRHSEEEKDLETHNQSDNEVPHSSSLALRADVMNKNIIRAVKRECKNLFQSFLQTENIKSSKKKMRTLAVFRRFAEYLLQKIHPNWRKWPEFDIDQFAVYLGGLSDYWAMKKITLKSEYAERMDEIYSILYKYSHTKFKSFLKIREVGMVFNSILSRSSLENVLANNESLAENKLSYKVHINTLLKSINSAVY